MVRRTRRRQDGPPARSGAGEKQNSRVRSLAGPRPAAAAPREVRNGFPPESGGVRRRPIARARPSARASPKAPPPPQTKSPRSPHRARDKPAPRPASEREPPRHSRGSQTDAACPRSFPASPPFRVPRTTGDASRHAAPDSPPAATRRTRAQRGSKQWSVARRWGEAVSKETSTTGNQWSCSSAATPSAQSSAPMTRGLGCSSQRHFRRATPRSVSHVSVSMPPSVATASTALSHATPGQP